jgi:hypothetical protein
VLNGRRGRTALRARTAVPSAMNSRARASRWSVVSATPTTPSAPIVAASSSIRDMAVS